MNSNGNLHNLLLRALILLGIIGFGFWLATERGFVELTLDSDRSYLSSVILGIYLIACVHWLVIAYHLSGERSTLAGIDAVPLDSLERREDGVGFGDQQWPKGEVAGYFNNVLRCHDAQDTHRALLEAFGDRVQNRHATGHFIADLLLKLGLLGTIIGFILMLAPVAEISDFDPAMMQQVLGKMSQGMAVALYTTLAGLITSTLLKLQYHIVDASAAELVTRVAELSEIHTTPESSRAT